MLEGKVRVLYVTPAYPVLSETFVRREVERLQEDGVVEVIVAGLWGVKEVGADVAVYGRGMSRGWWAEALGHPVRTAKTMLMGVRDAMFPGERLRLVERIKLTYQAMGGVCLAGRVRGRVDRIHAHFAHAPTSVAMYAAKQLGVPFSFTGHANDIFQRRSLLRRKLERAAFVACISRWHRGLYSEIVPMSDSRTPVIRCGVAVRDIRHVGGEGLRVLTVGRLVAKKGIDVLLNAAAILGRRDVTLTVAGDGPLNGPLRKLASMNGIESGVRFLGAVANEDVGRLLAEADVFVLPCQPDSAGDKDGIPVVLMEAMAAGLPVISGDLPAIRELVEDGVTGWLVPPGDAGVLADVMTRVGDDVAGRSMVASAGRAKVEREFELGKNVQILTSKFLEQPVL